MVLACLLYTSDAADDLAVMREQIGAAAVRGDEAKTLGLVEPLYFATSHFDYVPKKSRARRHDAPRMQADQAT